MGLNEEIRATIQYPTQWVRVANQALTQVESVMVEHDFDQAAAICTITCPKKWDIEPNDFVEVWQGYGCHHEKTFTGFVDNVDKETFPKKMVLSCRDVLKRPIDNYILDEIEYDSKQAEEIVADLLGRSGIWNHNLDTTNFTVGDVEPAKFKVTYAMDAIRAVADLIGWRCWATPDGTVVFKKVYPRGALNYRWHYTKDPTFGSESGIIRVNHISSDVDLRNWIEVWGWTNPTTGSTIEATAYADSPYVPDPPRYRKALVANEIIDTEDMADWIAARILSDLNQLVDRMEATIQGNPKLHIGDTVRITEDWTNMSAGVNYFVYGLSSEMRADGGYQMTLDLRGGRHSVPPWPEGQPPVASFEVKQVGWGDPTWIVYVDASASHDPDGVIVSYDFDWGDESAHGTKVRDNHQYSSGSPGDPFTITLVVTDDDGLTGSCSKNIVLGSSGSGGRCYDRVLVFADSSGKCFGSPDSGNNWNYFETSEISPGEFSPCNVCAVSSADQDGYAWFGSEAGKLYKSGDYCVSGTLVYTFGSAITALWLHRGNPDDLLVGLADGKVYRTLDGGSNWILLGTFEGPVHWVINYYYEPDHIWASGGATTGWLRESTDGGLSWKDHAAAWGLESVRDACIRFWMQLGAVGRTDPSPVRHSEDHGESWTSPTGITDQNPSTITYEPYDENFKAVGGDGGKVVWVTTDGLSYETSGSLVNGTKVTKLFSDEELYGTMFGGCDDDLELSFDHAATWKQLFDAPGTVNDIAQGPLILKIKRAIWSYSTLAGNKVYFSPTGGRTWITFNAGGLSNFGDFLSIVGHPSDFETAYMTSYDATNELMRVWKTTDGNLSWTQVGTISGDFPYVKVLAIDPINPDILWVGAGPSGGPPLYKYLYKSINGGADWTLKWSSNEEDWLTAVACSPATPDRILLETEYGVVPAHRIRLSVDGGDNWSLVSAEAASTQNLRRGALGFSPNGERVIYKGGTDHPITGEGARVAISTDAGNTWTWSAIQTPRLEHWDQNYPLKTDVGLNGHTMFILSLSEPVTGTTKFYRSDDLGTTWVEKLSVTPGRAFVIADRQVVEVLWAIGAGFFKRSDDNGENWITVSNPDDDFFDDLSLSGWQEPLI